MRHRALRQVVFLFLIVGLSGCLAEDPTSFREIEGILPGLWTQIEEPPSPPTLNFLPDGTFTSTSSGVPGRSAPPNFYGDYWQAKGVIAFRGVGFIDGASGTVEGVHVVFVRYVITESPLLMTMTEIESEYVQELVGVQNIDDMDATDVQSALRRLDDLPLPDSALGFTFEYLK